MGEDIKLYYRFLDGDNQALERLLSLYQRGLIRFIYGYVKDVFLAEDILQETFISLYFHRSFKDTGEASFKTYVYTIARNKSLNLLKKQKRRKEYPISTLSFEEERFLSGADVETQIETAQKKRILHQAISEVKDEYREVLILRFFDRLSPETIAKIVHKNIKQIYNLIARGKKAVKEILLEKGYVYENL